MEMKSKVLLAGCGLVLFDAQEIGKRGALRYYSGSLLYADLIKEWHETNTHGDEVIQVTAEMSSELTSELLENGTDKKGAEHELEVVLPPFFAIPYINDARCIPEETSL